MHQPWRVLVRFSRKKRKRGLCKVVGVGSRYDVNLHYLLLSITCMIMLIVPTLSLLLLTTARGLPARRSDTVIADGESVHVGDLPTWSFRYRSAGYLARGGWPECPINNGIKLCYVYKLSSDPTKNIDPSFSTDGNHVQGVILNSPWFEATGSVTQFNFQLWVDPALTSTSFSPFPLVQLVSKEVDNGPATTISFDVRNNLAGIYAFTNAYTPVVSVPLTQCTGRRNLHTWTIKGGPDGYADIWVRDGVSGETILQYMVEGQNLRDSYRIRIGAERVTENLTPLTVYWGDWSATPQQG
ncbi:unnamed protein product [Rhizoctonia solani]|uniref:Uncharacterized protein n=1 Tax=Rhizoctonia solani TaxID=456999 RepID=A0A8H3A357_9AGAM|nr:unnamed protein product [Rhizoctonia solani]